ncbi:hypothetical protein Y1Q_0021486 [Alligator mississippiensis]|uniref:Uncharacterized protein n=1 Tax=Alligator mississippiensis TaxID=8496 RepID=A0A151P9S8_ALLMI|nr:hypothetical protein Y1Q_0021486 [Alligator mississippiensis]
MGTRCEDKEARPSLLVLLPAKSTSVYLEWESLIEHSELKQTTICEVGKCSSLLHWLISSSGSPCRHSPGKFDDSSKSSHEATATSPFHLPLLGHATLEAGLFSPWFPLLVSSLVSIGHIFMMSPGPHLASQCQHMLINHGGSSTRVSPSCLAIGCASKSQD